MSSPADPELMLIFNFWESDLEANRRGEISQHQIAVLGRHLENAKFGAGCVITVAILIVVGLFLIWQPDPRNLRFELHASVLVSVTFLALAIILILRDDARRRRSEIRQPRLKSVEGQACPQIVSVGRGGVMYVITVSTTHLKVTNDVFTRFRTYLQHVNTAQTYRFYYTEKTMTTLSVEALESVE